MAAPAISVVVPARDAQATLPALLDALAAQAGVPFEVVVVDDGSRDATAALVERHPLSARLLRLPRSLGAAAARNAGVAAGSAPLLAFTDADCAPAPGWLAAAVTALSEADVVQGRVVPVRPPGPFERTVSVERESGLYETANLLVRRESFDRAGGFEDWTRGLAGRPFGEDAWFAWRARRAGARTAFAADALVHHAVFAGGLRELLCERARLRHFPALVARVPELRGVALHRRCFLSPRTAAFDLAAAGVLAAAELRRPWPLLAAVPYGRRLASGPRPAAFALADLVGALSLVRGSLAARSLVI